MCPGKSDAILLAGIKKNKIAPSVNFERSYKHFGSLYVYIHGTMKDSAMTI